MIETSKRPDAIKSFVLASPVRAWAAESRAQKETRAALSIEGKERQAHAGLLVVVFEICSSPSLQ
jgi:hypothetical protein